MKRVNKITGAIERFFKIVKPVYLFFIFTIAFLVVKHQKYASYSGVVNFFSDDADQYYSYLPAAFIHHDLSMEYTQRYWLIPLSNGKKVQKFTCGVAIMEAPFFLIGHLIAKNGNYEANGYSAPYNWSVYIGAIMYVLLGLFFVYRSLRFYFSELVATIAITIVFLCTNLFFYTAGYPTMSHSFLFFLDSVFIFNVLRWLQQGKLKNMVFLSLAGGLAVLARPTEILIFLFPLLIPAGEKFSPKEKISFLLSKKIQIVLGLVIVFVVFLPQLLYWKMQSGSFIHYSYGEERFFFADPKMLKVLFGYRNGMLPYSPLMAFALLGFIPLYLHHRKLFWAVLVFTLLNVYLLSCWWDYGFGGSLGNRALIQSYTSLAFPLAAFFGWLYSFFKNKIMQLVPILVTTVILWFGIDLNLLMSRQYKQTIIHWCGMNKETYWWVFKRDYLTSEDFATRERLIKIPDFHKMLKGEREY